MKQPTRNKINIENKSKKAVKTKKSPKNKRKHPEYGTSKLEDKFAKEFLDKLGVEYIRQFKAESIGRYFDFYLPKERIIIEIDGNYYHAYGLEYDEMSPMQKHNRRVDEVKDKWARLMCTPLIRIWEHDIHKNKEKVMEMLSQHIKEAKEREIIKENKKKRH